MIIALVLFTETSRTLFTNTDHLIRNNHFSNSPTEYKNIQEWYHAIFLRITWKPRTKLKEIFKSRQFSCMPRPKGPLSPNLMKTVRRSPTGPPRPGSCLSSLIKIWIHKALKKLAGQSSGVLSMGWIMINIKVVTCRWEEFSVTPRKAF